jgi:hypothetical protein
VLAVVYLPLLFVLVGYGLVPAAFAYLIAVLAIMPVEIGLLRLVIGVQLSDYLASLAGPVIATIVMSFATFAVSWVTPALLPLPRLALLVVVGAFAYVAALRVLAPRTFHRCRSLVRSALHRNQPDPLTTGS